MKTKIIFSALLLSISTLCLAAPLNSLDKKSLVNVLQDKTITTIPLATLNNKLVMNRVSIYFSADGKLEGKFAGKPQDEPQADSGTWSVKDDGLLCANWQNWSNGKDTCVYVYDTKNSLVFTNPAGYLDSVVLQRNIQSGNHTKEIKSMKEMKQMLMKDRQNKQSAE